ncbi:hypothetical protein CICLE_v100301511mg, partial [Citrus x clementina]
IKLGFFIKRESYAKLKSTGEMTSRIFVCSKDKQDHWTIKARAQTRSSCHAQMGINRLHRAIEDSIE